MEVFKLLALAVAGALWSAWFVLFLQERGFRPMRELLDRFSRLGWACKVGVLFIVAHLTMFGGAKHGGTNDVDGVTGTNDVEMVDGGDTNEVGGVVLNAPQPTSNGTAFLGGCGPLGTTAPTVTVRPYRLESVSTNDDISYVMPADGAVRGTWHLTGAYEDVQKVVLDGFAFPLGSDLCSSLWAYTWGKVRARLSGTGVSPVHGFSAQNGQDARSTCEISAVGAPMSAIPDISRFWTMLTTNDTYLMTWENFALGRIPASTNTISLIPHLTSLVSAQLELSRNGDFITRSNNVESVYRRVIEPNPIGPVNPPDPDNPTMPLHPYGPVQDLSVINETKAYCWVDIVVNNADAWVRFEGDAPSNLADPSFAAKAGETNHVEILIGKTYKVTCDMQFSIVAKSDPAIDAWWEDDRTLWLNWPVTIEAWEGNGNSFMMHVVPNFLGGFFSWTNSCCSVSGSGTHFSYSCDGHCYCTGCAANGYYGYEGYRIGCNGGWCGCSYVPGEWEGHDEPYDTDPAPSVSVWFEDEAVIFEDAYTNMPGEVVERSSTRTVLHLVAHGGMKGGTATFSFENRDKLVGFDIPTSLDVPAGHCKSYQFAYSGRSPSGSENDIKVHGEFLENNADEDSESLTSDAELTSVKVRVRASRTAVDNPNQDRHIYGVGEELSLICEPGSCVTSASASLGLLADIQNGCADYLSPTEADSPVITVNCRSSQKDIQLEVFEPEGYMVQSVSADFYGLPNEAGSFDLHFTNRILPIYVSFYAIEVTEIAMVSTNAIGYFAQPEHADDLDHGKHGAYGQWSPINADNSTTDISRMGYCDKPWNGGGSYTWPIPNAWRVAGDVVSTNVFTQTDQRFELDADGTTRLTKFGWGGERGTNCQYRVYEVSGR